MGRGVRARSCASNASAVVDFPAAERPVKKAVNPVGNFLRHRVDEALVLAVIEVESRYDAFAVSPRGAMGLMQLMPQTAARFAVGNAFNPVENVDGGVRYLKELLERYSGQVRLALAAYNAGEQAVDRFGGIPPFRETEQYVVRVTRVLSR